MDIAVLPARGRNTVGAARSGTRQHDGHLGGGCGTDVALIGHGVLPLRARVMRVRLRLVKIPWTDPEGSVREGRTPNGGTTRRVFESEIRTGEVSHERAGNSQGSVIGRYVTGNRRPTPHRPRLITCGGCRPPWARCLERTLAARALGTLETRACRCPGQNRRRPRRRAAETLVADVQPAHAS